jgi:putative transposase
MCPTGATASPVAGNNVSSRAIGGALKGRITDDQIAEMLSEAKAGVSVEEICKKYGISNSTFYKWKRRHGSQDDVLLRRLHKLEEENSRLKSLVADLSLRNQALKQVASKKKWS